MNSAPEATRCESSPPAARRSWFAAVCHQVSTFFIAVRYLTRVPVPRRFDPDGDKLNDSLRSAAVYFPLVGTLVGAATAGVILGAEQLWAPWPAVLIGMAFEALLTGAIHEDGVADFCDAMGGGWTRDDVLRIFKDSRVGSFGVLGLTLAILLKAAAIVELDSPLRFDVIVASATLGRWVVLCVMALLSPIPDRPGAVQDIGRLGPGALLAGTILAAPGVALMALDMPIQLAAAVLVLLAGSVVFTLYLRRRIGGVTGDCLGFACFAGQVIVLLVATARINL